MAERKKVLAREPGLRDARLSGLRARVALAGSGRRGAGSGTGLGRDGAAGPSVAARGRLSAAAMHALGARRRARAHLYFAAGSLQPRAGLALAPPLKHLELVDWPPEKQAHFPPPLSWRARNLRSRRGAEWSRRGWGGGRDHSRPGGLTSGSPLYLTCKWPSPLKFQMELSRVGVGVGTAQHRSQKAQDWVLGGECRNTF